MNIMDGPWRHYKGGRYTVIGTAETHEHNGDIDVVYWSLTHNKMVTRPLRRDSRDQDSWEDLIAWPDGAHRRRFELERNWPEVFFTKMFEAVK